MSQVFRNIASNALKFSPAGSVVTMHAVFVPIKTEDKVVTKDMHNSSSLQFMSQINRVASALSMSRRSSTASVSTPPIPALRKGIIHRRKEPYLSQYTLSTNPTNTFFENTVRYDCGCELGRQFR